MKVVNRLLYLNVCVLLLIVNCLISSPIDAQSVSGGEVYVDRNGIMRFKSSNDELHGFGVNYTMPFAYAYRNAKKMGIDIKQAIDNDVYHFARLGFDAFRVHVWDTEISDTLGNLLDNEHLELFDYMLWKMKERGIRFLITPIAYWGNGWPERDEKTPGFSYKYGKDASLTNPGAIKAQQNYLFQFLNHVNRFTNIAYKHDTSVIAFEICNEPHHGEAPEKVTTFIKSMIASMRNTGCKKPIFYNISHKIHLADAYFKAGIEGGTFQWYPTGLGFKKELQGNFLPNVDEYKIPFADNPGFKKIAKVVYEFDAADVGRSYIYPAMARSFRTAGIQWATHFAYDPTYSAYANTEYDTHFMNLVYAPQKALSLMIAGEVFHRVPLYKSYGAYPNDTLFDVFHISYANDLAEMITDKKFIYTNNTSTTIHSPKKLEHIAGVGNSQLVKYAGKGAYFLDKLADGVWRLEVMPDAIWTDDPFGRNSLQKSVSTINWSQHQMIIHLPDFQSGFSIRSLNPGTRLSIDSVNAEFLIRPGTFLLKSHHIKSYSFNKSDLPQLALDEFFAPPLVLDTTLVIHQPAITLDTGRTYLVKATILSRNTPKSVVCNARNGNATARITLRKTGAYEYAAEFPTSILIEGFLRYAIVVEESDYVTSWPSGKKFNKNDNQLYTAETYNAAIIPATHPVYLFNAFLDAEQVSKQWNRKNKLTPGIMPHTAEMQVFVDNLFVPDNENRGGEKIFDYTMRFAVKNNLAGREEDLSSKTKLVLYGRSLNEKPCTIQVALVTKDAVTYGGRITLQPSLDNYVLELSSLHQVKQVLMPRPYPSFLPYYFENKSGKSFDIGNIESIQMSIGPGMSQAELEEPHGISIINIRLQ